MISKINDNTVFTFKIYGLIVFCSCYTDGLFWFRLFGYGLHFKNFYKHTLLFSQRHGKDKSIRWGHYLISFLNKVK